MTLSLVLGYALTGLPAPELPRMPEERFRRWLAEVPLEFPQRDLDEELRNLEMDSCRIQIELLRILIQLEEDMLARLADRVGSAEADHALRSLARLRKELAELENRLRDLQRGLMPHKRGPGS